ncbi:hypothetical protein FA95DRAFT_1561567 [Auriscalpium vulgare]|uniref:Uncharacterized protein n=1 Tax=Auriscalpium vulgare TaxID=40419 RepID=A0ACB8RLF9_9AGAM|nr:hypothetical protein FA95DRAFT_1561567 [Auriscalpium vulgare]
MKLTYLFVALSAALTASAGSPDDYIPHVPRTLRPNDPADEARPCVWRGSYCDSRMPCCNWPLFLDLRLQLNAS